MSYYDDLGEARAHRDQYQRALTDCEESLRRMEVAMKRARSWLGVTTPDRYPTPVAHAVAIIDAALRGGEV